MPDISTNQALGSCPRNTFVFQLKMSFKFKLQHVSLFEYLIESVLENVENFPIVRAIIFKKSEVKSVNLF